jgi:hypothetical protein
VCRKRVLQGRGGGSSKHASRPEVTGYILSYFVAAGDTTPASNDARMLALCPSNVSSRWPRPLPPTRIGQRCEIDADLLEANPAQQPWVPRHSGRHLHLRGPSQVGDGVRVCLGGDGNARSPACNVVGSREVLLSLAPASILLPAYDWLIAGGSLPINRWGPFPAR